jgi:hypothetical protein
LPSGWSHTNPVEGLHLVRVAEDSVLQSVDFLASQTPPATELGAIDFLEIADLDLTGADRWYCAQTTHAGLLTIEARFQGLPDQAQVTLYDAGLNALAASGASEVGQRIDWSVDAGRRFYFSVTGDSSDVDLRLANLVSEDGAAVVVYGTDGDDRFEFVAGASHQVTINGVDYEFSSATRFEFDRGRGDDSAVLVGSSGSDTVVMHPSRATLIGPDFRVRVYGAPQITVTGGGGCDVAYLYDSAGDDQFVGTPTRARLYGDGFDNRAFAFRYAHGYSLRGGTDVAKLFDNPEGRDTFQAWPHMARLFGSGYYNRVKSFRFVHAYATTGGADVARFYDDPGRRDVFEAWPHQARLYGSGYYNRARSFRYVRACATDGGADVARLYDSPGNDLFVARPDDCKLYGAGFHNRTLGFRYVHAYSDAGGYDRAHLHDSAGNDHLRASRGLAALACDDLTVWARAFDWISAVSSRGGTDAKYVESLDYVLQTQGPWTDL